MHSPFGASRQPPHVRNVAYSHYLRFCTCTPHIWQTIANLRSASRLFFTSMCPPLSGAPASHHRPLSLARLYPAFASPKYNVFPGTHCQEVREVLYEVSRLFGTHPIQRSASASPVVLHNRSGATTHQYCPTQRLCPKTTATTPHPRLGFLSNTVVPKPTTALFSPAPVRRSHPFLHS